MPIQSLFSVSSSNKAVVQKETNVSSHMISRWRAELRKGACMLTAETLKKVSCVVRGKGLRIVSLSVDTIDKWDEDKLKEVVQKKHGEKNKPKTDIVSNTTSMT